MASFIWKFRSVSQCTEHGQSHLLASLRPDTRVANGQRYYTSLGKTHMERELKPHVDNPAVSYDYEEERNQRIMVIQPLDSPLPRQPTAKSDCPSICPEDHSLPVANFHKLSLGVRVMTELVADSSVQSSLSRLITTIIE